MNTDTINEKITNFVNDLFLDFQNENGIASGDLPFDLTFDIDNAIERLTNATIAAMEYQKKFNI